MVRCVMLLRLGAQCIFEGLKCITIITFKGDFFRPKQIIQHIVTAHENSFGVNNVASLLVL